MSMKGTVKYANYSGTSAKGTRNHRKRKLAKVRMEEAIRLRLRKQAEEKLKNIAKGQYAKEAKEWSERFEY